MDQHGPFWHTWCWTEKQIAEEYTQQVTTDRKFKIRQSQTIYWSILVILGGHAKIQDNSYSPGGVRNGEGNSEGCLLIILFLKPHMSLKYTLLIGWNILEEEFPKAHQCLSITFSIKPKLCYGLRIPPDGIGFLPASHIWSLGSLILSGFCPVSQSHQARPASGPLHLLLFPLPETLFHLSLLCSYFFTTSVSQLKCHLSSKDFLDHYT